MPYIIAEIGFNHEGNMDTAKNLIEAAASSGANAVKFQTYRATDLALPSSSHFKAIRGGQMNLKQHRKLASIAKANRVDFLSTPYSLWAVDLLEKIGVKAYKIASMDLTNLELLQCVVKTAKPLIVSTGMATLSEIKSTVQFLRSLNSGPITLLHCLSKYPASHDEVNLEFMHRIREECRCSVGYSDHTIGTMACFIAAILGAEVIEKHFTLDNKLPGADHYHSAEPAQLKQLIKDIDLSLSIIGAPNGFNRRPDRLNLRQFKRGIYASMKIPKGTKIRREHLIYCRPNSEFSPLDVDKIVGQITKCSIEPNASITRKCL